MIVDTEDVNKVPKDKTRTIKQGVKHTEEKITNHNGLNHSEFAAAARLVSTPFVENLSPPKLHCSSIQAYDERHDVSENPSNVSSLSYNANNSKVFSPILECSDEDAKNVLLKASSYSSGVLTKSNVLTIQLVSTSRADATFEDSFTSWESKVKLLYTLKLDTNYK